MLGPPRKVLIVSDDLSLVDRFVPLLLRSDFTVRRTVSASGALKLVAESPFSLVVIALPCARAHELVASIRAPGSPCQQAALLLLADERSLQSEDRSLARHANRIVAPDCAAETFQEAVALLLDVAPRIEVRAWARMKVHLEEAGEPASCQVHNVSSSGMLLTGCALHPVATVFGFELFLPTEREPIRGRGKVARLADTRREGIKGLGVEFMDLHLDGRRRLHSYNSQTRAAARARSWMEQPGEGAPTPEKAGARTAGPETMDGDELARREVELAELTATLDQLLSKGLARRLRSPEWYLTGVELGLESLREFSEILELVYQGETASAEGTQRIANLVTVYQKLGEFAAAGQTIEKRVRILLEIRPALERLLRELAESGRFGQEFTTGRHHRGAVSQVTSDINRLLRRKRSLEKLEQSLTGLLRPGLLIFRRRRRQEAAGILQENRFQAAKFGFQDSRALMANRQVRASISAIRRESGRLEKHSRAIHAKVFGRRFRGRSADDLDADLSETHLYPVLADVLAAGYEYLVRAYSAYRHSLEMAGADPELLDRAAGLAASIDESRRRGGHGAGSQAASSA